MVNKIKVQVCDRCNIISPDVNCSNDTCMDCGEPLVLAEFVRRPKQRAVDGLDLWGNLFPPSLASNASR